MKPYRWILDHLKVHWFKYMSGLLMALLVSFLSIVNPKLLGRIIDDVIKGENRTILLPILLIMLGVTILKSLLRYNFQVIFEKVSQDVIFEIRKRMYQKLQLLDFEFYDNTRTGDIMSRMTGDLEAVRHFVAGVIRMFFENATLFIFALIVMISINVYLTLCLVIVIPLIIFFAQKLVKDVTPTFKNIREKLSALNSVVQENIKGNRVVKAFVSEDFEKKKFHEANEAFKKANLESAHVWQKYLPVLDVLGSSLSIVVIVIGGIFVINELMTFGEFITFNSLLWAVNNPLRTLGWLLNDTQNFLARSEKIISLLESSPKIDPEKEIIKKTVYEGNVEFKDVSLKYEEEYILYDVSFKAQKGSTIALVGPTGSGKTSIINLMCRFYDATEGAILFDRYNIKNISAKQLRNNISIAMQDVFLFSDTIENNIAFGVPNISTEQIIEAAKIAKAHDFITKLPQGYKTIIGEQGVGLSGGQKQRVSLARAIIKNTPIMILDDTTSALDTETEYEIQKSLKQLYTEKTVFIISHRISSVKDADLILVLDNGKIIERGTHQELLDHNGYYAHVFINQMGNFNDEEEARYAKE